MLMALDQFVFGLSTLAHQELQRQTQWKHASHARVNARDAGQYTGPGDDTITLSGVLVPELTGSLASLDELRAMGDKGQAYVLVDGAGQVYGAYAILQIRDTSTYIRSNGKPRRVEFAIELKRQDDNRVGSVAERKGTPWAF